MNPDLIFSMAMLSVLSLIVALLFDVNRPTRVRKYDLYNLFSFERLDIKIWNSDELDILQLDSMKYKNFRVAVKVECEDGYNYNADRLIGFFNNPTKVEQKEMRDHNIVRIIKFFNNPIKVKNLIKYMKKRHKVKIRKIEIDVQSNDELMIYFY